MVLARFKEVTKVFLQIINKKPWYQFVALTLSVSELYGGFMTFGKSYNSHEPTSEAMLGPEWITGNRFLDASNFLKMWVYLVFANSMPTYRSMTVRDPNDFSFSCLGGHSIVRLLGRLLDHHRSDEATRRFRHCCSPLAIRWPRILCRAQPCPCSCYEEGVIESESCFEPAIPGMRNLLNISTIDPKSLLIATGGDRAVMGTRIARAAVLHRLMAVALA
jgi:hypothetical protein